MKRVSATRAARSGRTGAAGHAHKEQDRDNVQRQQNVADHVLPNKDEVEHLRARWHTPAATRMRQGRVRTFERAPGREAAPRTMRTPKTRQLCQAWNRTKSFFCSIMRKKTPAKRPLPPAGPRRLHQNGISGGGRRGGAGQPPGDARQRTCYCQQQVRESGLDVDAHVERRLVAVDALDVALRRRRRRHRRRPGRVLPKRSRRRDGASPHSSNTSVSQGPPGHGVVGVPRPCAFPRPTRTAALPSPTCWYAAIVAVVRVVAAPASANKVSKRCDDVTYGGQRGAAAGVHPARLPALRSVAH